MKMLLLIFLCYLLVGQSHSELPNIIFVVGDDIGYPDIGPKQGARHDIAPPFLNSIMPCGISLENYYSQSLCTPARASILTGRYAVNTGLNHVLVLGTPAGLPENLPTIPEVLSRHSYTTAMVGKWHLGHAQHKMTPVGRGFESFVGIYTWDADSYTKEVFEEPWKPPLLIDWTREFSNGTKLHYAEPVHTTRVITSESIDVILNTNQDEKPLFLYIAYTAAHSPLQPLPEHVALCNHIPNDLRRQYCGMVMGLDDSLKNITSIAKSQLPRKTLMIFVSDNGGSPWFGGLNSPLRGGKGTPFEGGVRVPSYVFDLDNLELEDMDGLPRLVCRNPIVDPHYSGLVHSSDWLPTILGATGLTSAEDIVLDGVDASCVLNLRSSKDANEENSSCPNPRSDVLLEYLEPRDNLFGDYIIAIRQGKWKLVEGYIQDALWYETPANEWMNFTSFHPSLLPSSSRRSHLIFAAKEWTWFVIARVFECIFKFIESIWGPGRCDTMRIVLAHTVLQRILAVSQVSVQDGVLLPNSKKMRSWLFDLEEDPTETTNIVSQYPDIANKLRQRVADLTKDHPPQQKVWFQYHLEHIWKHTFVPGDCSRKEGDKEFCLFTDSWIPDVS